MVKELYCIVGGVIGLVVLLGLGIYLGAFFLGTFFKYLLLVAGAVFLAKGCTTYLAKKHS